MLKPRAWPQLPVRPTMHDACAARSAAVAIAGLMVVAAIFAVMREEAPANGPTVDEKIAVLRAERASLQARADSEARIGLLPAFRTAGLLFDALALRSDSDGHRAFDLLPAFRRHAFGELDALNGALKDALDSPRRAPGLPRYKAAAGAAAELDRLAADDAPLILSYAPRFVPPRRATGELTLRNAPVPRRVPRRVPHWACAGGSAAARHTSRPAATQAAQAVPRYAPDFAAAGDDDPPLQIEIVGPHLAPAGEPAAGAVDRRVARTGDGGARAPALFGAARGLRDRCAAHELRGGGAVRPARLAHGVVPAPVHGAARPPGIIRLRPADAHDDARIQHPGVARDPGACAARARPARCAAASIRRPAGASTRSVSAWSSSSGWAGRTMSAIRR